MPHLFRNSAFQHIRKSISDRRGPKSIHHVLSALLRAYSVLPPGPEDVFPLFDIITIEPDRPRSPRRTSINLRKIFEILEADDSDLDESVISQFLVEFTKVSSTTLLRQKPQFFSVSQESMEAANVVISPSSSRSGIGTSLNTSMRELQLLVITCDSYEGGDKLKQLLCRNAEVVFIPILQDLVTQLQPNQGEKVLLGIVTKRIVSKIGLSHTSVIHRAARSGVGREAFSGSRDMMDSQEEEDLQGVSGLHFIPFTLECVDTNTWRFYPGTHVINAELDENDGQGSLCHDMLYQRLRCLDGEDVSGNTPESDVKTLTW